MIKDEVIALAREAELYEDGMLFVCTHEELTRFANAIEGKLMERLLAGSGEPVGWSLTCNGQHTGNFYRSKETILVKKIEMDRKYPDDVRTVESLYTADQTAAAVLREREECAKVAQGLWRIDGQLTADEFAAAIRARGYTV